MLKKMSRSPPCAPSQEFSTTRRSGMVGQQPAQLRSCAANGQARLSSDKATRPSSALSIETTMTNEVNRNAMGRRGWRVAGRARFALPTRSGPPYPLLPAPQSPLAHAASRAGCPVAAGRGGWRPSPGSAAAVLPSTICCVVATLGSVPRACYAKKADVFCASWVVQELPGQRGQLRILEVRVLNAVPGSFCAARSQLTS